MRDTDDLPARVRADLGSFAAAKRSELAILGPDVDALLDAAALSVSSGKRLRAAFCHAGWVAAGGAVGDPRALWAASSLEWLQASALVHDDVIDASDLRRGRPSAHREFENDHRAQSWRGDPTQFGTGAAILLGDLMLGWCEEMFRGSGFSGEVLASATPYLDACKNEVVAGQYLDLVGQARAEVSVETAMRVVRYKSAKYTVERPLHLGAALAGAGADLLATLTAYGLPLGEAFQLRDDVLGVFGDPAVTGKPIGDDLREGKRTVLVAHAATRASAEQRELLHAHIGDASMSDHQLGLVREVLVSTGALAQVETDIAALEQHSAEAIAAAVLSPEAHDLLTDLADRATRRTS